MVFVYEVLGIIFRVLCILVEYFIVGIKISKLCFDIYNMSRLEIKVRVVLIKYFYLKVKF